MIIPFPKKDDSNEGLLKELNAYIEGTDQHEQIMAEFDKQHPYKPTEYKTEDYPLDKD